MSEWYFDLELEEADAMIHEAVHLDSNNLIYQWIHYARISSCKPSDESVVKYAQLVLQEDSPIKKELMAKGSLGEYIYGMMNYWATEVLEGKIHINRSKN